MEQTSIEQIRTAEKEAERALINGETHSREIIKDAQQKAAQMLADAKEKNQNDAQEARRCADAAGEVFLNSALAEAAQEVAILKARAAAAADAGIADILSAMA